jgi:Transposase DNA-binding/Transposase Tn5 dimerisation domain
MLTHLSPLDSVFDQFQILKPGLDPDPLWAFNEFAKADFNDQRLTHRLQLLAKDFVQQPLASIPQACGNWANSKAAYRFCSNQKVSFDAILAPHYDRTLERVGQSGSSVVLCPQDTTTLNYIAHPATQGLGHVGTKPGKSLGMLLHSTVAVSPQGQFYGLVHAHCWTRPKKKSRRRSRNRHAKKISEKETFRWLQGFRRVEELAQSDPQHFWVSVNDREADIYEMIQEATLPGHHAGLLVRARHDRSIVGEKKSLFRYMGQLPSAGTWTTLVPRHEDQPAREVTLSLAFAWVRFPPPRDHAGQAPVGLWAVWAKEIDPPAGQKPICWCLLTTVPVATLADAIERIQWYIKRWTIEDFHRVLKSGCQVEARQLTTRERLQRALALDMVVAWRVMDLNKAARLQPEAPADRWLSADEWQALYCYAHQTQDLPSQPPTIRQAVHWIAQLGGFLARKSDGLPGNMTVWRGLQRLKDIVGSWQAFGPTGRAPQRKLSRRANDPKRCG